MSMARNRLRRTHKILTTSNVLDSFCQKRYGNHLIIPGIISHSSISLESTHLRFHENVFVENAVRVFLIIEVTICDR